MTGNPLELRNGSMADVSAAAPVSMEAFRSAILGQVEAGSRLSALFSRPAGASFELVAVLSDDQQGLLSVLSTEVGERYTSLTPDCPQAHMFEREIHEQCGVVPEGHPWLKPVRFLPGADRPEIGRTDYFQVTGEEVHEVAVGPVHAGVIEPGHFRFQCHGERVFTLEISLGYQHRGVERAVLGGPGPRTIHHMETLAGDTTIGHATAYCQNVEALAGCQAPPRALALRSVMLELERMANHIGDLGALAADVGYLPTSSFCGAIRGDVLNATALICGNRFGRGVVRPGGVAWDVDQAMAADLIERVKLAGTQTREAADLLWDTPSVMARFQGTGELSLQICRDIGLVGPAARACGAQIDIRANHRPAAAGDAPTPVFSCDTSDVYARALVRWLEVEQSIEFAVKQLEALPDGPVSVDAGPLQADSITVSMTEGWRGEICHCAITDGDGKFGSYKIVDPSFHNWFGLALALREQEISDFPLCNKSFNLSYCGFDL